MGQEFRTAEDVFAFSPLAQGDFTGIPVVGSRDYSDEEALYRAFRAGYPASGVTRAGRLHLFCRLLQHDVHVPLLTFGWELFLETCLIRFDRIMEEFAEINRRVFRSFRACQSTS